MPAIRAQSVNIIDANHATLTLDTVQFGVIFIDVLKAGTTVTITSFQDSIQKQQIVLTNPPAATIEAQIDSAVTVLLPGGFQFRSHLISNSPLVVTIGCFNPGYVIPAVWW